MTHTDEKKNIKCIQKVNITHMNHWNFFGTELLNVV